MTSITIAITCLKLPLLFCFWFSCPPLSGPLSQLLDLGPSCIGGSKTRLTLLTSLFTSLMNPLWPSQLQSGNRSLLAKFLTSVHVMAAHLELGLISQLLEAHALYGETQLLCGFFEMWGPWVCL